MNKLAQEKGLKAGVLVKEISAIAGGKGGGVRQFGHKTLVIGQRRRDAGLLEHDLRYPGIIGIVFISPGQDPFVFIVPFQKGFCNVFRHIVSFL